MTLSASLNIFALISYERYKKVLTPLNSVQPRTLKKLYCACCAIGFVGASLTFAIGGYRLQPSGSYTNVDATHVSPWRPG